MAEAMAMKSYGQFCPVAMGAEVFAERWTPLIVREMACGSRRFSDLERGLPRISKSILAQRLRFLEGAGVVERQEGPAGRGAEYLLTQAGRELAELVLLLGDWGQRWADMALGPHNMDPDLLMWDIHRRICVARLPDHRVVAQVDLTGAYDRHYWLLLERPSPSICWHDPGFDVDLVVTADTATLHRVWMGQHDLAKALRDGLIVLDGPSGLCRAFPDWLAFSLFVERRASASGSTG
jgi:DNA-binding HxlR family transcriptional regulator